MSRITRGKAGQAAHRTRTAQRAARHLLCTWIGACLSCSGRVTIGLGPADGGTERIDASHEGGLADAGEPACGSPVELRPVPLDLVLMLDRSFTMNDPPSKWAAVSGALKQFSADPASSGLGMAMGFLAIFDASDRIVCDVAAYEDLPVKMGTLNAQAEAVATAIDGVRFESISAIAKTPMNVALQGAIAYSRSWATQHRDHDVVIVFITDGRPNGCESTFENVTAAAAEGAAVSPSIRTHVIGILGNPNTPAADGRSAVPSEQLKNLNGIAAAGQTGSTFVVDTESATGIQGQLASALSAIRQAYGACHFAVPQSVGGAFDTSRVMVRVGTTPLAWKRAAADCGSGDGYFYDDPARPAALSLCESTCARVTADKLVPAFLSDCHDVPAELRGAPDADVAANVCRLNGQSCEESFHCCSSACCMAVCSSASCND